MAVNRADLHTHTTASDGMQRPADNIRLAKEAGLAAIAITDHDTVDGIAEAMEAGERLGIIVVPGVEISTSANGGDVHILGYYTDWQNEAWRKQLGSLLDVRDRRNEMIVERLSAMGITITLDEVTEEARKQGKDGGSVGRPHIASLLLAKGYVASMQEAFDVYLGSEGSAYVNPPRLHPFEAVDWIRDAGGTSVIAHPGLYGDDGLVEEIIRYGANGIEVYHSDHSPEDEARYLQLAKKYNLTITGGSDYHGERQGEVFHGAIGHRTVDVSVLDQLNRRGR
ncbi:PHP domain-containing protein [Paenibacillus oenotherae]|uniref:PHP domain-containing protein n=1 Tax=Paenibacillus oenotherae TaxID=1435645 RepID=A0ABS7D2R6_9BACL|nr:PHP domain-containing protein [Paenibacillus oenotherae]MBW7474180.1 PHP domain-containing protein [Paenibacillus oenotherae]